MVRFIASATIGSNDIGSFQFTFSVPGSGFFRNLNITFSAPTDGNWTAGFGKLNVDNLSRLPVTDGSFQIQQTRKGPNIHIWGSESEKRIDQDIGHSTHRIVLRRSDELYCKSDELYGFRMETSEFSTGIRVLIEAEYVLYNNSMVKHIWEFESLSNSSDFNAKYQIPYSMRNATLRLYGRVTSATGDSGLLVCRVMDKDDLFPDNATAVGGSGVIDSNVLVSTTSAGDSTPWNNMYSIHVGSQETGLSAFDRTFPVTKLIHPGDALSFEIVQPSGTFTAGDLELYVEITGRSMYSRRMAYKAQYRSGYYYLEDVKL